MTLAQGTVLGGKYVVDRLIGTGGMGSVYLCRHATLDAPFALKLLRPELAQDEEAMARFEREAKASAALRTRHVVRVHDHGVDGDCAYIVMELLEGEDLRVRMNRLGRLSRHTTCDVIVQAARGLHYAHAAGIVHRDLKPANIFLAHVDGEEVVKILDFGIAKVQGTSRAGAVTQTGALMGSPHYMSPEQIRGHWTMVDHRTDLWALAVVAFRALTGQLPFLGDVVGDVLVKVCIDPIPVPSTIAPDLSPEVDRFFARALARERDERFRSGLELATALATALGYELDLPDPTWGTPTPGDSGPFLQLSEHDAAATRKVADEEGTADLADPSTLPMPAAPAGDEARAAAAAAGTLTDAGSLQLGPRRAELPRRQFAWIGGGVAVAIVASVGLILTAEPESSGETATGVNAAHIPSGTAREARPSEARSATTTVGATTTTTVSSAAPAVSGHSTATPARPAAPRRPSRPKDPFRDRFGY